MRALIHINDLVSLLFFLKRYGGLSVSLNTPTNTYTHIFVHLSANKTNRRKLSTLSFFSLQTFNKKYLMAVNFIYGIKFNSSLTFIHTHTNTLIKIIIPEIRNFLTEKNETSIKERFVKKFI